jgi:hypothetical protein
LLTEQRNVLDDGDTQWLPKTVGVSCAGVLAGPCGNRKLISEFRNWFVTVVSKAKLVEPDRRIPSFERRASASEGFRRKTALK